jgi:hypothetical protein
MCNAHNHPLGCDCGWGPPYPTVTVTVRELYTISDISSKAAMLDLGFPVRKTQYFDLLNVEAKKGVLATAVKHLQQLADDWFGKDVIKVEPVEIRKGSIVLSVLLYVVPPLITTYVVFKYQNILCKKIEQFPEYIGRKSLKLYRVVRKKYLSEEQRSLRASETIFEAK